MSKDNILPSCGSTGSVASIFSFLASGYSTKSSLNTLLHGCDDGIGSETADTVAMSATGGE